jgi:hypothetical protein
LGERKGARTPILSQAYETRHTEAMTTPAQSHPSRGDDCLRNRVMRTAEAALPEQRLQDKLEHAPQVVVFQVIRDSQCSECGAEIPQNSLLLMEASQPLCMTCAGLGEFEFLPAGDTALTRRASKYSSRTVVVVRFSRSRKRYERQGILVEPKAIGQSERECTEDAEERAAARGRAAKQQQKNDGKLAARMAEQIRALFPGAPPHVAMRIAEHTARRGSGRVGRTEAGRKLDEKALTLAVIAAVRHNQTNYDDLLASGVDRTAAREQVADRVDKILAKRRGAD